MKTAALALSTLLFLNPYESNALPPATFVNAGNTSKARLYRPNSTKLYKTEEQAQTSGRKVTAAFNLWDESRGDACEPATFVVSKNRAGYTIHVKTQCPRLERRCNLEAIYAGIPSSPADVSTLLGRECFEIGPYRKVDYGKNLEHMWDAKIKRYANPVLKACKQQTLENYRSHPHKTTLETYTTLATNIAQSNYKELDWEKVQKGYKLTEKETKILKRALKQIEGDELIAYLMTELFPSHNGTRNKDQLEELLRNAGRTYIESVPAMYDKYCSFGGFQFTSFAVNGVTTDGASKMNQYLDYALQIPGSVSKLKGDDHLRAAHLFVAHNLALVIGQLNDPQQKSLENYLTQAEKGSKDDDLIQYAATAHHLPSGARKAAKKWLDNKARADFSVSCSRHLKRYADKTKKNYRVLR